MARGEFRIAKQLGVRGYFGRVSLDVEPAESGGDVQIAAEHTRCRRRFTHAPGGPLFQGRLVLGAPK